MLLSLLLGAIFLAHGVEEAPSWDDRLKAFDVQIERLEKIASEYQDRANEVEVEAQPLALRDWSAYAAAMQRAEEYGRLAIQTKRKIEDLKKQRQQLLRPNHDHHHEHEKSH